MAAPFLAADQASVSFATHLTPQTMAGRDGKGRGPHEAAGRCIAEGRIGSSVAVTSYPANGRKRRCLAIGAPRAELAGFSRNLSFGKLACCLIGGAGGGTVGIEEATMRTAIPLPVLSKRAPWNKGRLIGQKRPLKPKDVWAIRVRLQLQGSPSIRKRKPLYRR